MIQMMKTVHTFPTCCALIIPTKDVLSQLGCLQIPRTLLPQPESLQLLRSNLVPPARPQQQQQQQHHHHHTDKVVDWVISGETLDLHNPQYPRQPVSVGAGQLLGCHNSLQPAHLQDLGCHPANPLFRLQEGPGHYPVSVQGHIRHYQLTLHHQTGLHLRKNGCGLDCREEGHQVLHSLTRVCASQLEEQADLDGDRDEVIALLCTDIIQYLNRPNE